MRKSILALAAMSVVSLSLAACGQQQPQQPLSKFDVAVADCMAGMDNPNRDACVQAVSSAQQNAPRYSAKSQCEAQFGYGNCESRSENGQDIYGPLITGMLISQMLNSNNNGWRDNNYWRGDNYRTYYRSYSTSNPNFRTYHPPKASSYARSYSNDNYAPAPTVKRGGFGQTAANKSYDKARAVPVTASTSASSYKASPASSYNSPATSASSYNTAKRGGFGATAANDNSASYKTKPTSSGWASSSYKAAPSSSSSYKAPSSSSWGSSSSSSSYKSPSKSSSSWGSSSSSSSSYKSSSSSSSYKSSSSSSRRR
jgi:uncharacterized protein YgiB involved in biofilm formation